MRVLFVVPYAPSPVRVRPYNLIRSLVSMGHQVHVLTVAAGKEDRQSVEKLRSQGAEVSAMSLPRGLSLLNCVAALPTRMPMQAVFSWSPSVARRSAELAFENGHSRFDVVHVEHLRGSRYGLYLKSQAERRGLDLPIVWDSVDCISLLFRQASTESRQWAKRLLCRFELKRTEEYESYLLRRFRQVLITSAVDRQALLACPQPGNEQTGFVSVLPNGVDLLHFRPNPELPREPSTLIVTGKMSYHANVAMVLRLFEQIMPRIWKLRPDVKVVVAGQDPPLPILALARNPRIRVTGRVDDLRPYLLSATVAVAPVLYGVGIQNKLLEAMACGTPVVTTPNATRALQAVPGRHLLVSEKPEGFVESVLGLLDNTAWRTALGEAGREYVEEHHDWQKIAGRLTDLYGLTISQTRGQRHALLAGWRSVSPVKRSAAQRYPHSVSGKSQADGTGY